MTGRLALALAAFAAIAAAQPDSISSGSTGTVLTITSNSAICCSSPKEPTAFIVQYETTEKCFECGFRYAIGCTGGKTDCGVPDKQVSHFEEFSDIKQALQFINRSGPRGPHSTYGPSPENMPDEGKFVRLWSVKPVELSKRETATEEPQPPKVTVEVKWSVKGSQQ